MYPRNGYCKNIFSYQLNLKEIFALTLHLPEDNQDRVSQCLEANRTTKLLQRNIYELHCPYVMHSHSLCTYPLNNQDRFSMSLEANRTTKSRKFSVY